MIEFEDFQRDAPGVSRLSGDFACVALADVGERDVLTGSALHFVGQSTDLGPILLVSGYYMCGQQVA